MDLIKDPWPWYVAGPLIGLMVPALLLIGNKALGISSSLRHICAACIPTKISFFRYDWKSESWNLFFVGGILLGGLVTALLLTNGDPVQLNPKLVNELSGYGIIQFDSLVPKDLFNWRDLFTVKGFLLIVAGGFMVGFGTRYAGGCTSGHAIMGLSNLQWPSLVATISFMGGGYIMSNYILPAILRM